MDYEEAIRRVKAWRLDADDMEVLSVLIPELKESEDERIRKGLVNFLQSPFIKETLTDEKVAPWLAFLEKQKEQIPYIDFVIKPHKGDDNNPYDMRFSEAQEYTMNRGFDIPWNDGDVFVDERYITQTIGNILRWADEHPKEQKPAEKQDYSDLNDLERAIHRGFLCAGVENVSVVLIKETAQDCLAQIEQKPVYEDEYQKMLADSYKCGKNEVIDNPEKYGLQKPAAWSEEDLQHKSWILECLADGEKKMPEYAEDFQAAYKWLKSLRHKPHWKPSEGQMDALWNTLHPDDPYYVDLSSLYNDLKKL